MFVGINKLEWNSSGYWNIIGISLSVHIEGNHVFLVGIKVVVELIGISWDLGEVLGIQME